MIVMNNEGNMHAPRRSASDRSSGQAKRRTSPIDSARCVVPQRGFTLIETALATIIVGVGVIAIMIAQAAFHKQNSWSTHASIATQLGNEIREMTLNLPRHDPVTGSEFWGPEDNEVSFDDYDDLDDFDGSGSGSEFSADLGNGPINARRELIAGMDGWSQAVRVFNVDPLSITSAATDGTTNMIMVEVVISYRGPEDETAEEVTSVSWIAPN
jgi:prepilin-type N-terminal cleavage/methylation domain-containing protein